MSVPEATPDAAGGNAGSDGHVSSAALDQLRSPLAVISGRAQLLQRRIQRGQILSPDDYLEALANGQHGRAKPGPGRSRMDMPHRGRTPRA
jgi:hypothetical protein